MTEFWGIVAKTQTMADGGIRITLDLPESAIVQMAELAAYQIGGVVVDVVVTPRNSGLEQGNGEKQHIVQAGSKRQPKWTTEKEPSTN